MSFSGNQDKIETGDLELKEKVVSINRLLKLLREDEILDLEPL